MASNEHNISRRQTLVAIGLAGATAVVPVAGSGIAKAADRSLWEAAHAHFQRVNAEYDRRIEAAEAAEEAAHAACPRVDSYFDEHKLGIGMNRKTALGNAQYAVAIRAGEAAGAGKAMTDAEVAALYDECPRVVDDFMVYQERHKETERLYRVKELNEHVSAYRETYFEARDAFMRVPAPDAEALLAKMEIASTWLDDPYVDSAFADARRLLAGRA